MNNKERKVYESHINIKDKIIDIDNKYKNLKLLYNKKKNKYYRYLKKSQNITKYAYVTTLFCDAKYLSSILVTGFYLKYFLKTKYDIICLVQDKPYYETDIKGLFNS